MTVVDRFRSAFTAGDAAALDGAFAEDAVLHSPAVISTEYRGRELVTRITGLAMRTLSDVRFTDELHGDTGGSHALVLDAAVGGERVQGVLYFTTGADGLITGLTFMLRPLRGVQAFVETMLGFGAQPALDHAEGVR